MTTVDSCIYVIPKSLDPLYPNASLGTRTMRIRKTLPLEQLGNVRALPARSLSVTQLGSRTPALGLSLSSGVTGPYQYRLLLQSQTLEPLNPPVIDLTRALRSPLHARISYRRRR